MGIFIRTDSSIEIGTGHVMRCLTFANKERAAGNQVSFICRKAKGDSINFIKENGFSVYELPFVEESLWSYTEMNWEIDAKQTIEIINQFTVDKLVVDHYSLDEKWESKMRKFVKEIFVIDDLANRPHNCDILLDQNFYLNMSSRYNGLVSEETKLLLGPKHALLRDEFVLARKYLKKFNGKLERLFIFFGGSDPTNETEKVVRAIAPIIKKYEIKADVIVGKSNPNKKKIKQLCELSSNFTYYCQINNVAELMAKADLAIGAGGTTTWERAYLSLPSIVIAVADNQVEIANALNEKGIIYFLGLSQEINESIIISALQKIITDVTFLNESKANCIQLFK